MNPYSYEELARLRLQDMQREAENRRLLGGAPPSATTAALRRLIGALSGPWAVIALTRAAVRLRETRVERSSTACAECGQEVA